MKISKKPKQAELQSKTDPQSSVLKLIFSVRVLMAVLSCFGLVACQLLTVNINLAWVCMVNSTAVADLHHHPVNTTNTTNQPVNTHCMPSGDGDNSTYQGKFVWDRWAQANILGVFFLGIAVMGFPAGFVINYFGVKWPFFFCVLLSSILTCLIPKLSYYGWGWVVLIRALLGLLQAIQWPAIMQVTGMWAPRSEKSLFVAITTAGNQLSYAISMPLFAYLCSHGFWGIGWPSIFYVSALFGGVWCILWALLASSEPNTHHFISEAEKNYILKTVPKSQKKSLSETPLKSIFTSMPILAILFSFASYYFMVNTMKMFLPDYYKTVLGVSLEKNALSSSMPTVCQFVGRQFASIAAGFMTAYKAQLHISPTFIIRFFNTIANFALGIFFIPVTLLNCNQTTIAVVLVCLAFTGAGISGPGMLTSMVVVSPSYTGSINGIANILANFWCGLSPYIVAAIVGSGSKQEWGIVFYLAAALCIVSGIFFAIFGSGEVQSFDTAAIKAHLAQEQSFVSLATIDIDNEENLPSSEHFENNATYLYGIDEQIPPTDDYLQKNVTTIPPKVVTRF